MRISDWSSDVCSSDLNENPSLGSSAGRKNGLSLSDMSLALGMSKTRPSNLLSAEAEHALSKLTIDKEAAVRCLFMPAGYERSATSTIGGTDDMRCVRVREIPRRGQPVSYRPTVFAQQLGPVARSEERRVGNECGRTCRSRWSPHH